MEVPRIPRFEFTTFPSHPDCPIAYTLKALRKPVDTTDTIFSNTSETTSTAISEADSENKPTLPVSSVIWLIFVNGLGLPQAFWQPAIQLLESDLNTTSSKSSPLLSNHEDGRSIYVTTYDRYGQGLSHPPPPPASSSNPTVPDGTEASTGISPNPSTSAWTPKRHNCLDAATELAELIHFLHPHIHPPSFSTASSPPPRTHIVLIGHSLGVPIVRLFMAQNTQSRLSTDINTAADIVVRGVLLIDSNMASINMVDLLPDPDSDSNREQNGNNKPSSPSLTLPSDTTIEQLRQTRENYAKLFAPSAPNAENIDRVSLLTLLPRADEPVLRPVPLSLLSTYNPNNSGGGDNGKNNKQKSLLLTVIAHDPDAFAEEGLRISTRGLTQQYIEPAWREYNLGLLRLGGSRSGLEGKNSGYRHDNDDEEEEEKEQEEKEIVVAKGAGHFVQRDNPRCVADEIWKMLGEIVSGK